MDNKELVIYKNSISSTELTKTTQEITNLIPNISKKDKFATSVVNVIRSEEFITELDTEIGSIRENENKEQFIARGKSIVKKILYRKFNIK
ncbi:hypothetical protein POW16_29225 [Raoultella planticola]|uniref:hypothetical protein n=1 Tax=Raoultella planticola TaxID=575 RepID=UPI002FFB4F9F